MAFHSNEKFTVFKKRVYLSSPTMHGEELTYINEAYNTNWMSTIGENIDCVEKNIAQKTGCKYAIALSSGTAALHMCVKLAGIKEGDTVLCSDMTFAASVNPVVYEGGKLVFVDTEYDTWNMDPVALEKAFEKHPNAKAVIVVHLYGVPGKIDEIRNICKAHSAVLIEDAAESFGATYKGEQTGVLGDIGAISFNGNKIITGTTGCVFLTNNKETAYKVRKLSTQSREKAPWYQHEEVGYNYRMSNIVAGVIRGQLPHLEEHISQKKAIYERYKKGFAGLPLTMNPYDSENSAPNFWLSCAIIDKSAMCHQIRTDNSSTYIKEPGKSCPDEILEALASYNAEGRPIWKPMHLQPVYKNNDFITANGVDIGSDIFERGFCLPSDNKLTESDQNKIIEIVRACFE